MYNLDSTIADYSREGSYYPGIRNGRVKRTVGISVQRPKNFAPSCEPEYSHTPIALDLRAGGARKSSYIHLVPTTCEFTP